MPDESTIHIAFAFSKDFLTPFYVLITSIISNNLLGSPLEFHAITSRVEASEQARITAFVEEHKCSINFYTVSDEYIKSFVPGDGARYGLATYYRLFFPHLLPPYVQRYIYLDTDTIVVGSLRSLFDTDFAPAPLAAAPDAVLWMRNGRGLGYFFNAGVLVIDRARWQELDLTKRCIDFMQQHPHLINYADQDALNGVLEDNWHELEDKYNFTFRAVPPLPHQAYAQLLKDKVVIHYNESVKPWNRLNTNRLGYLYAHYFKLSPQAGQKLYDDIEWTPATLRELARLKLVNMYLNRPFLVSTWRKLKNIV